ncbi:unnamed protein product, partial [Allacma fusca]
KYHIKVPKSEVSRGYMFCRPNERLEMFCTARDYYFSAASNF